VFTQYSWFIGKNKGILKAIVRQGILKHTSVHRTLTRNPESSPKSDLGQSLKINARKTSDHPVINTTKNPHSIINCISKTNDEFQVQFTALLLTIYVESHHTCPT